jgi:D-alanine-D-alanine ligase
MKKKPVFKKLRTIVLVHEDLVPPDSTKGLSQKEISEWKTEYDVISTLKKSGHEVVPVGVYDDLGVIQKALEDVKPHIAFNLLEEFHGYSLFDQHVVSYLELRSQKYTGCNPRGLTLAHDKALAKKILAYHRILTPGFAVFSINRKVKRPKWLRFPLLVKSLSEEGSVAISRASLVYDDEKLEERVEFVHRQTNTHAIAEEYIQGRELYVAVLGNERLQAFTPWELFVNKLPDGAPLIATMKVKWDYTYQEKVGVITQAAELSSDLTKQILHLAKRCYRILHLSGYARLDYRLKDDGSIYMLEANPNPNISDGEDFAASARTMGIDYDSLLQKIMTLGLSYKPTF